MQKLPVGIVQHSAGQQTSWPSACICLLYANFQFPEVHAAVSIHFTLLLAVPCLRVIWLAWIHLVFRDIGAYNCLFFKQIYKSLKVGKEEDLITCKSKKLVLEF